MEQTFSKSKPIGGSSHAIESVTSSENPPKDIGKKETTRESFGKKEKDFKLAGSFFGIRDSFDWQSPWQKKVRKILTSPPFEYFMAFVIVGNFVLIVVETDHLAQEDVDTSPQWITVSSWSVLILFVVELAMRLYSEECRFFHDPWNGFDFVIIASDLFFSSMSVLLDSHIPVSVLRVLRLSKVARISKLVRVFPELRLMVVGLMGAMRAMLCGTVLLFIALLVLSVVAVQIIHPLNIDVAATGIYGDCVRCDDAFATVMGSTLTFTQQILAGDSWGLVTIPIIETYPASAVFFISVYLIIGVAILNLILGVVVDVAQQARYKFEAEQEQHKKMKQQESQNHLLQICYEMDADNSGCLTKDELVEGYDASDEFRTTLHELGVEKEELDIVWICLDSDKSGHVSYTEFVTQLYSMKTSDMEFMLAYVKYYITIIKDEIINGMGTITNDLTIMMNDVKFMAQSIQETENQENAKLDALLMHNTPSGGGTVVFPTPTSNIGATPTATALQPQRPSVVTDAMEEIRRNQADLGKRFLDLEMKLERTFSRSLLEGRSLPKPAGLSLWQVPAACQHVTTARKETLESGIVNPAVRPRPNDNDIMRPESSSRPIFSPFGGYN